VDATPIANGNDWSRTMRESLGKSVNVVVLRDKHEQTLALVPDGKRRSELRPGLELPETVPLADPALALSALLWFNQ
jgi:serine protease Do